MSEKLKIGVFGGFRGQTMIDVLLDHPDAELTAVCDKYTPLLSEVKEKAEKHGLNVALYESFDEFIKHDMDAVVLANYATEHAIYAVKCLRAGARFVRGASVRNCRPGGGAYRSRGRNGTCLRLRGKLLLYVPHV